MPKRIWIDEDIAEFLRKNQRPYESESDTLRGYLPIGKGRKGRNGKGAEQNFRGSQPVSLFDLPPSPTIVRKPRRNRPRTKLPELIRRGYLKDGEPVYLHDYSGKRVEGWIAHVTTGGLRKDGQIYAMSELAMLGLKEVGYKANEVRGPMFWYTADGRRVMDLWETYLAEQRSHAS